MPLYAVDGQERHENGRLLDVCLILGVGAVVLVLAYLKPACTAEHNVDDPDVADDADEPLPPAAACAYTYEHTARPGYHLSEIIRAAHDTVETGVDEALGIHLLCGGLLRVGHRLDGNAKQHHCKAYPGPQAAHLHAICRIGKT